MKKLFISQPMRGKSDKIIIEEREKAIKEAKKIINDEVSVIDSFFKGETGNHEPLYLLGESIKLLSNADVAYFFSGWESARGCKLEHDCAIAYGIPVIEEDDYNHV